MRQLLRIEHLWSLAIILVILFKSCSLIKIKFRVTQWTVCDLIETPFFTKYNLPVQKCVEECATRARCRAVTYTRQRRKCELYETESSFNLTTSYSWACAYISKADMTLPVKYSDNCLNCTFTCRFEDYRCMTTECIPLEVENAEILGNIHRIDANVQIVPTFGPLFGYSLNNESSLSKCRTNGTWSNIPNIVLVSCPADWLKIDDSCYLFSETLRTQQMAEVYCASFQAHLAMIETERENTNLYQFLTQSYSYNSQGWWLGIDYKINEGDWVYSNTNDTILYAFWATTEPNNLYGEDCAILSLYFSGWLDVSCWDYKRVICERN